MLCMQTELVSIPGKKDFQGSVSKFPDLTLQEGKKCVRQLQQDPMWRTSERDELASVNTCYKLTIPGSASPEFLSTRVPNQPLKGDTWLWPLLRGVNCPFPGRMHNDFLKIRYLVILCRNLRSTWTLHLAVISNNAPGKKLSVGR